MLQALNLLEGLSQIADIGNDSVGEALVPQVGNPTGRRMVRQIMVR